MNAKSLLLFAFLCAVSMGASQCNPITVDYFPSSASLGNYSIHSNEMGGGGTFSYVSSPSYDNGTGAMQLNVPSPDLDRAFRNLGTQYPLTPGKKYSVGFQALYSNVVATAYPVSGSSATYSDGGIQAQLVFMDSSGNALKPAYWDSSDGSTARGC